MTNNTSPAQAVGTLPDQPLTPGVSSKSFLVTWLMALIFGFFAADRFYLGKIGTGILKLVTFGGFGVWVLIDLILVLCGAQRDKQGRPLAGHIQYRKIAWIVTGAVFALSIIVSSISGALGAGGSVATGSLVTDASPRASDAASETAKAGPSSPPAAPTKTAAPTPPWADTTYGAFTPATQTGTGDSIVSLPAGGKAGIVTATHSGKRNFSLSVLDASNGSTGQLLVNTIGSYTGTTAYGFTSLGTGTQIQVTADGAWTITISPVSAAPALKPAGTGDAVFLYTGPAGKLAATHTGSRNFVVMEETGEAFHYGLLVNKIGAYSGTVPLSKGPSVLSIQADGNWTMLPS